MTVRTPNQSTFLIVFANFSISYSSLSDIMEMHLFLNAPQCKMCRLVNVGASFFCLSHRTGTGTAEAWHLIF